MPNYNISTVAKQFEADAKLVRVRVKSQSDPAVAKPHDEKVMKALMGPFKDIQNYYKDFAKKVTQYKTEAKRRMDAIEKTLDARKGKLDAGDWKLLEQDAALVTRLATSLEKELKGQFALLGEWRSGGEIVARNVVFTDQARKLIDSMVSVRTKFIKLQTSEWTPELTRIQAYKARLPSMFAAAEKAAKEMPGDEQYDQLKKAFLHGWQSGGRSSTEQMTLKMNIELRNAKDIVKKGAKGAYSKHIQSKYDELNAAGKALRGGIKTLKMQAATVAKLGKAVHKSDKKKGGC